MLLAVPMEGFRARPTLAIGFEDARDLPDRAIGDEDLARFRIVAVAPEHDEPYRVVYFGDAYRLTEPVLGFAVDGDALTGTDRDRRGPLAGFALLIADLKFPIELEIAHVHPVIAMDVVQHLRVGKIAVEGEDPWDAPLDHPIDQVATEVGMAQEWGLFRLTQLPLAEAAKLQRIVFARATDVVNNEVTVGNQVALVGVIPEPAHILDQLAIVVDEGVVERDGARRTIAGAAIALQQFQASGVELGRIPGHLGQPAIEAGLVGGDGKLPVDPADVLPLGHKQSSQILGKVPPFRFVGKQVAILRHQLLH